MTTTTDTRLTWRRDQLGTYHAHTEFGEITVERAYARTWTVTYLDGDHGWTDTLREAKQWAEADYRHMREVTARNVLRNLHPNETWQVGYHRRSDDSVSSARWPGTSGGQRRLREQHLRTLYRDYDVTQAWVRVGHPGDPTYDTPYQIKEPR